MIEISVVTGVEEFDLVYSGVQVEGDGPAADYLQGLIGFARAEGICSLSIVLDIKE